MSSILDYITNNGTEIAAAASAFVLFFDRVAQLIPNDSGSGFLTAVYKLFSILGLQVPETPGN